MGNTNLTNLENQSDYQKLLLNITKPVLAHYKNNVKIGTTGTVYSQKINDCEGFFRLLWGYAPYYVNQPADEDFEQLVSTITSGVNPKSNHYWGELEDVSQLMVEMAPLAFFLILNKEKVWPLLSTTQLKNLFNWLNQINSYQPARNNWLMFRVLVNVCLEKNFASPNREQIETDLAIVEEFYLGNGWYFDGHESQRDYYVSFAIHYYALIYSVVFEKEDPTRSRLYKERAAEFATTFQLWFDKKGRGIPFGRSLTYRFAQSAFWSAMLYANVTQYPLEESKYLLKYNLEYWMGQAIFDNNGLLTIGYAYPNLIMSEEYNGPGSPYWALKSFLLLAIPATDGIWQADTRMPTSEKISRITEANMILVRGESTVQAYPTGQHVQQHTHGEAKYTKFVYATNFAFNVSKGAGSLTRGAYDNTLALSEQDCHYRVRMKAESYFTLKDYLITKWRPWSDVTVTSYIIPDYPWHVRLHKIETKRPLTFSDGGFSVPSEELKISSRSKNKLFLQSEIGTSGVVSLSGANSCELTENLPNVNLLYNSVNFPYIKGDLSPGKHTLCHVFYGSETFNEEIDSIVLPKIILAKEQAVVYFSNRKPVDVNFV